jgi:predicted dehydrogenase
MSISDDNVRWGIVGTSGVAVNFVSDLRQCEASTPWAVASRDPNRGRKFAEEMHVPHGGDLAAMLSDPLVDVVYIATPPATHHDLAIAAFEAGKHVIIEKPVTVSGAETLKIVAAANRADRFLMEAMWMTFNPAVRRIRQLVDDGAIGTVRSVRASFGLPFPSESGSRWNPQLGGSSLYDQGIYAVTLANMFLGDPIRVDAGGRLTELGVDGSHWATLEYTGKRMAQLAGSMLEYMDPSASINGTDGWISIDAPFWSSSAFTVRRGDIASAFTSPETIEVQLEGNGYVPMIRSICNLLVDGAREHPEHTHAQMLATHQLLSQIRKQIRIS